jgi:hypothetical protein
MHQKEKLLNAHSPAFARAASASEGGPTRIRTWDRPVMSRRL